jgi:hypothetical protein
LIVDPSASDIGAIDEADEWLQVQFGCGFGQNKLSTYHCNIASYNHVYHNSPKNAFGFAQESISTSV